MFESTTSFDECTLELQSADERADALRNEAKEYERAVFLSEATEAARREPTDEEIAADFHRFQAAEFRRTFAADLLIMCEAILDHQAVHSVA
jgi:hypothetical protein